MPIGNLTSQIFANIYLNELDRFVMHSLKPDAYLRYGDDFILIAKDRAQAERYRCYVSKFLKLELRLSINPRHDEIRKVRWGLNFLGIEIFSSGRRLNKYNRARVFRLARAANLASYVSLLHNHEKPDKLEELFWQFVNQPSDEF